MSTPVKKRANRSNVCQRKNCCPSNQIWRRDAKKTNKKDTKISFREYDISFVGDWSKAITVVTNFTNTSDALITIEKIQISSDETNNTKSKDKINTNQTNNVKVDMVYRIYIK